MNILSSGHAFSLAAALLLATSRAVAGPAADPPAPAAAPGKSSSRPAYAQRASRLRGLPVTDLAGRPLGRVRDLLLDWNSARVAGALVAPADIYGDIVVLSPPPEFAAITPAQAVWAGSKTNLLEAPRFPAAGADPAALAGAIADSRAWFGESSAPGENSAAPQFLRASRLIGATVRNKAGADLGTLLDLLVDLPLGRTFFAVVALDRAGQQLVAVPAPALYWDAPQETLLLDARAADLAPMAGEGAWLWTEMLDPDWAAADYRRFGLKPDFGPATDAAKLNAEDLFPKLEGSRISVHLVPPVVRSDAEITRDLLAAIVSGGLAGRLASDKLNLSVAGGRVQLRGTVSSAAQKQELRSLAERVAGPGNVDDQLELRK